MSFYQNKLTCPIWRSLKFFLQMMIVSIQYYDTEIIYICKSIYPVELQCEKKKKNIETKFLPNVFLRRSKEERAHDDHKSFKWG